jgi:DNA-binding response OmpR family regulator
MKNTSFLVPCGCIIANGEFGNLRETAAKFTKTIRKPSYELRQSAALLFRRFNANMKPYEIKDDAKMAEQRHIYIADDDDNIRQVIRTFLISDGYAVEDFPTGDLLLERFRQLPADLVILDVMMPGSDGFTVCTELRKSSTVPIIMLTARDSENDFAMGLGLGSDDYITKPFSAMALLMRVRAIFRRIDFESQKHAAPVEAGIIIGRLSLDEEGRHILRDGKPLALTPTEYEVLKYLMLHAGQAVSREDLLNQVWGFETAVETRATDDTVRRLRQKLDGCGVAIAAVWGFGFRLEEKA